MNKLQFSDNVNIVSFLWLFNKIELTSTTSKGHQKQTLLVSYFLVIKDLHFRPRKERVGQ